MAFAGILLLSLLFALLGWMLAVLHQRTQPQSESLVDQINQRLPQTQCAQCGFPGCKPYAEALANQHAPIDLCPPGGPALVRVLRDLLGRNEETAEMATPRPQIAWIDEPRCIGCALCLKACPVDAILGAPRFLHTVIEAECTGCELCIPVCPVDCIDLRPARVSEKSWR
jgi:electron transport complex protein RnfB